MKRAACIVICAGMLAACDNGEQRGLQQELAMMTKDAKGRVDPLPQIKPYTPVTYAATDQVDPFSAVKIRETPRTGNGQNSGDKLYEFHRARVKEPLESFALETLKMVGTLQQKGDVFGLVRADQALYRVKVGNYIGQNFGVVTKIADDEIVLKELIQDGAGDWSERITTMSLQEAESKK
jgi:type IV pilus assembly protein PilP